MTARADHTATLLGSGEVLATGGEYINGSNECELSFQRGALRPRGRRQRLRRGRRLRLRRLRRRRLLLALDVRRYLYDLQRGHRRVRRGHRRVRTPDTCTGHDDVRRSGGLQARDGQACPSGASTCASGFCSDGVCCNTACGGACDVCTAALGASADGTCSTAPPGYAGSPACGSGVGCDGADVSARPRRASPTSTASAPTTAPPTARASRARRRASRATPRPPRSTAGERRLQVRKLPRVREWLSASTASAATALQRDLPGVRGVFKQSGAGRRVRPRPSPDQSRTTTRARPRPPATCGNDGQCNGKGAAATSIRRARRAARAAAIRRPTRRSVRCATGAGMCSTNPTGVSCGNYLCATARARRHALATRTAVGRRARIASRGRACRRRPTASLARAPTSARAARASTASAATPRAAVSARRATSPMPWASARP